MANTIIAIANRFATTILGRGEMRSGQKAEEG
jgi:hypothetical protein